MRARALVSCLGAAVAAMAAGCGFSPPQQEDASRQPPKLIRLSASGPEFLNYDGEATLDRRRRDWPVSLLFVGHATVKKVRSGLRAVGLTHTGSTHYLAYRVGGASLRFDGDRGLKQGCNADGSDVHVRVYAPTATDHFADPRFGSVVVGTAHIDRADNCSVPPTLFGFSEDAEQRVGQLLARHGWRVQPNHLRMDNGEPYRRDVTDAAHVWRGDGRATVITVP